MNRSCVINREEVTARQYAKLFALKLRQFEGNDYGLTVFLQFHYRHTFERKHEAYEAFLLTLQVHDDLLSAELLSDLQHWQNIIDGLPEQDLQPEEPVMAKAGWPALDETTGREPPEPALTEVGSDTMTRQREKNMAAGALTGGLPSFVLPGRVENPNHWTKDELIAFFAPLCQSRPDDGKSYLQEEDLLYLFQNGIHIPAELPLTKIDLYSSQRYPKILVDQFIQHFILHYNEEERNRILQFFGCYIKQYGGALCEKGLMNLKKNMSGAKPSGRTAKRLAQPEDYLPRRLQVQPKHRQFT